MYTILIVDDERNERAGIEKLIQRYQFDLDVLQASNGEEALKLFETNRIHILLTDIKMPFMTGMELIEAVHKRGWDPVCIIYSAYGEFEYAQNAISLGVLQYLLKPIKLNEFQELFQKIFEICKEKEEREKENKKIEQNKKIAENEKIGRAVVCILESETDKEGIEVQRIFEKNQIFPVIVSSYSYLFSRYWDQFIRDIQSCFTDNVYIINRDDTQTLLLIPHEVQRGKKIIAKGCEQLIDISKTNYHSDLFIAAGNGCAKLSELKAEYDKLKELLDYQFFISESILMMDDEGSGIRKGKDMLPVFFEKIITGARLEDYEGMKKEFEKAFQYVEKNIGFSSIYIKYNFSEVIKKCCEILHNEERMIEVVENIYGARSLCQVKDAALYLIDEFSKGKTEQRTQNHTIAKVREYIREEYGDCTLSVASLADRMGITAAYLSSLFKVETGQNLVKYLSAYRMEKAKELLVTTNMKIGEISESVGYPNTSYFISLFKTNVGCSPLKYREKVFK